MIVFARSSPFQEGMYSKGVTLTLPMASQCTPVLLKVALTGTKWVYQEGVRFKKAGVVMMGLVPDTLVQGNLFDDDASRERSRLRDYPTYPRNATFAPNKGQLSKPRTNQR